MQAAANKEGEAGRGSSSKLCLGGGDRPGHVVPQGGKGRVVQQEDTGQGMPYRPRDAAAGGALEACANTTQQTLKTAA